ncbi:HNH endonuclease [Sphingobium yanoikuyae]|uniref:HNH endonuclease n=1 Tax=Sphingobium yanoikuyae TaxID=13690 RepID=A0A430BZ86_SPHYA|nr:HNH endonuclease [Sphingobium yanoikuyae]RSU58020.1 HNH endonuclease [Sphingobium yanoikuyae]
MPSACCLDSAEMLGFIGSTGATNTPPSLTKNRIRGAIMAAKRLPSVDLLRQLLRYERDTGKLFWHPRTADHFTDGAYSAERKAAAWNARYAGQEAFTDVGSHGYRNGSINGKLYLAHRVIWAMETGEWPEGDVDHRNGVKTRNEWLNLRAVPHSINMRNMTGRAESEAGVSGVQWRASRSKWRARIMVDGKERCIGHFDSKEEAVAARLTAQKEHGFTDRHGMPLDLDWKSKIAEA